MSALLSLFKEIFGKLSREQVLEKEDVTRLRVDLKTFLP